MATIGIVALTALIVGLVSRDTNRQMATRRYIVYQSPSGRLQAVRRD